MMENHVVKAEAGAETGRSSTAAHTPGPWHFVEENAGLMTDHGYGILYGEPDSWGWEKNLYVSVGCSLRVERELGKGVAEANARLIAAAPEMLEALKDLLTIVEGVFGEHFAADDASPCSELCAASDCQQFGCITGKIVDARAALAKAEGRQP
jgi:hypothetical protein